MGLLRMMGEYGPAAGSVLAGRGSAGPAQPPLERRAALDIGSGCTKLLVADVDTATNRCVHVVLTREVPVLYGMDIRRSKDGRLSDAVQAEGLAQLGRLVREAEALGPKSLAAVATEAFRRAPNGGDFVSRVKQDVGLDIRIIDQGLEARLGLRTAVAVSSAARDAGGLIAWDCGGASYQLVAAAGPGAEEGGKYRTHCGALGDAVATAAMVELQGRDFAAVPSPNPVSLAEAEALVARLQERMPEVPAWLLGSRDIVAIGGRNSMFALLADTVRASAAVSAREDAPSQAEPQRQASPRDDDDGRQAVSPEASPCRRHCEGPALPTACTVTAAAAWEAVHANVGCSDEELARRWCWRPDSDPPAMVIPKLCLIIASLTKFEVESAEWRRTVGCCPGVLAEDPAHA